MGRTRPKGVQDQIVRELGRRIVRAELKPGDVLPDQLELSRQLGVSRTVLREATRTLIGKGLLESKTKIGTTVQPRSRWSLLDPEVIEWLAEAGMDEKTLRQVLEIREIMEPAAAELAALRASDEQVAQLKALYRDMETATTTEELLDADMAYHSAIVEASHNELLIQLATSFAAALRAEMRRTIDADFSRARSVGMPAHRAVLDAIVAGQATEARSRMTELVARARDLVDGLSAGTVREAKSQVPA